MSRMESKKIDHYMNLSYTVVMRCDEDGDVVAEIQELPGCIAHGEGPQEAWNNVRDVQRAWIEERIESGGLIPEPEPEGDLPSGKFLQRVARSTHKALSELAKREQVSLNSLVSSMITRCLAEWAWKPPLPVRMPHHTWEMPAFFSSWSEWMDDASLTEPLLHGLNFTRKLITAPDESKDAYNPKDVSIYKEPEVRCTTTSGRR